MQPYPPPPPPPPGGSRRWLPAAIIAAGIVIAGALIGGAVIASNRDKGPGTAAPSATGAEANSTTCQAWKTTRTAINAVPGLPAGWDWDTPNIDTYINNLATAVETALALFEPKIADEPANVAAAARAYIEARQIEFTALKNRTFTGSEAVPVNMALGTLNQLCGITP